MPGCLLMPAAAAERALLRADAGAAGGGAGR
eukprot:CAMPEP_0198586378 /NCGR_PEP_ID=MMETSP1462-20131121/130522_1 /TAXON_ID=1333877 /ORGANISM="Brandtodinium nutriculum, Strain RCC3387" /LENGTH=30 /DNA_ID= /DNA_START= /DNA_END= /DNA_ORIENTATION=